MDSVIISEETNRASHQATFNFIRVIRANQRRKNS